jgi:hypothetical protein
MRLREILDEAEAIKPKGPLTPAQSRREDRKRTAIKRCVRDVQAACAREAADLRSKV